MSEVITETAPASGDTYRWITNHGDGRFGEVRPADDFLHWEGNAPGASTTETYYFGFHIPEEAIHAFIYIWVHPNLKVVTAGVMITRGFQRSTLAADYFDARAYLAVDEHVKPDGSMQFPMGLTLTPIDPMRHWHIKLDAPGQDTFFDVQVRAAQLPVVRADQKHFDQNMHIKGELKLRGQSLHVDCCQVRDRSWSNARPEEPMPVPPYDWLTLTDGADFALNLSMFDDLSVLGNANGAIHLPPKLLQDGWVAHGRGDQAELRRIVDVTKKTYRTADTLMPTRHEIVAVDEQGQRYELVGESVGGGNWNGWPNMIWNQNLIRWTCNGRVCWGESQEVHWHELVRRLSQTAYLVR